MQFSSGNFNMNGQNAETVLVTVDAISSGNDTRVSTLQACNVGPISSDLIYLLNRCAVCMGMSCAAHTPVSSLVSIYVPSPSACANLGKPAPCALRQVPSAACGARQ